MDEEDQNGITAYHGSPHDFEQFDTSKIGTGEGAQWYGHGLYFAEAEPVAKSYKENLANPTLEYQSTEYGSPKGFGADARARILDDMRLIGKDQALQKIKDNINFNEKYAPDIAAIQKSHLDWAKLIDPTQIVQKNPGHMYEVAIDAHPDHFLDWDKPLSEQGGAKKFLSLPDFARPLDDAEAENITGQRLYQRLESKLGQEKASATLHSSGIQGIRYLDAGSRGNKSWVLTHPQGGVNEFPDEKSALAFHEKNPEYSIKAPEVSHNYVVFDHNRVKIKRKYERGGFVRGYNDGGFIPHGDPMRNENLAKYMEGNHPDVPHVVYHGTTEDFSEFDPSESIGGEGLMWFTNKPDYASAIVKEDYRNINSKYHDNANIMPVHLNMKNPYIFDILKEGRKEAAKIGEKPPKTAFEAQKLLSGMKGWNRAVESIINEKEQKGHDGLILKNFDDNYIGGITTAYLPFYPHQIKSAIGNNGNFDPQKPSINEKRGGFVRGYNDGGGVEPEINNPMSVFPKPQRMFPEDAPVPGGQYLSMPDQTDMTGHKSAAASIGVRPGGKPYFTASRDAVDVTGTPGKGSATAKTNLFKQKAGWNWKDAPEGHENTNTIVSVEHRGQHHYALNAHFPKGVDLARYENSTSEPRLRPTTKGNVEFGPQAGSILVRGREHPVYHHVIVKNEGGSVKRPTRATGGRIPDADKLFKEAKKELDRHTKPMLSVDDDAIVNALRIAQGRV